MISAIANNRLPKIVDFSIIMYIKKCLKHWHKNVVEKSVVEKFFCHARVPSAYKTSILKAFQIFFQGYITGIF